MNTYPYNERPTAGKRPIEGQDGTRVIIITAITLLSCGILQILANDQLAAIKLFWLTVGLCLLAMLYIGITCILKKGK